MILRRLLADGHLRRHRTSAKEVADLWRVVDRDLAEARAFRRDVLAWLNTHHPALLPKQRT